MLPVRVLRCTSAVLPRSAIAASNSAHSQLVALYNRTCQHIHNTARKHRYHTTTRCFVSTTNNNPSGDNADVLGDHTADSAVDTADRSTERRRNRTDIGDSSDATLQHSIDDMLAGKVTDNATDTPQHSSSSNSGSDDTTDYADNPADAYTDILDINNPPKLNINLYRLLVQNNLTIDDIDLGPHTEELRAHLQFIMDGIKHGTVDFSDHEQVTLADYGATVAEGEDAEQPIEAELGYTMEGNAPPHMYKTTLPVDKLSCQFCAAQQQFMYKVRQANKQQKSYEMNDEIYDMSDNLLLHFSNVELLYTYLNERGMVTPRHQNGNCAKHQRKLAQEIKRARYIGLLSYVTRFKVDESYVRQVYGSNLVESEANRRNAELLALSEEQRRKAQIEADAMAQMIGEEDINDEDKKNYDTPSKRRS